MKKLDDAVRRFGSPNSGHVILEALPGDGTVFSDTGNVTQLQARNLRLKIENNRLHEMLNERDEELDRLRNPKPLKWVCAAVLVGLVFILQARGLL